MGIMDKFKSFIGIPEDEYYEDDLDFISNDGKQANSDYDEQPAHSDSARRGNKVVNIHATTQLQVVLVKPERFDDASSIADHLNNKRTVVLNLESTNKDVSRRLIDFLSGVAYANNGQIKRVANSTYIITPYNVDIMGDLLDELESNGVFF
jgi:cell division inhibitor SepF